MEYSQSLKNFRLLLIFDFVLSPSFPLRIVEPIRRQNSEGDFRFLANNRGNGRQTLKSASPHDKGLEGIDSRWKKGACGMGWSRGWGILSCLELDRDFSGIQLQLIIVPFMVLSRHGTVVVNCCGTWEGVICHKDGSTVKLQVV